MRTEHEFRNVAVTDGKITYEHRPPNRDTWKGPNPAIGDITMARVEAFYKTFPIVWGPLKEILGRTPGKTDCSSPGNPSPPAAVPAAPVSAPPPGPSKVPYRWSIPGLLGYDTRQ